MNDNDRELLTTLAVNIDYIKAKVTSLDERVAIQNGRVTEVEKLQQHSKDTINEKTIAAQIHKAIDDHEEQKFKRNLAIMGGVVALVTLLINIAFHFIN